MHKLLEPHKEKYQEYGHMRQFLLNCIADSCDKIEMDRKSGGRTVWKFYFDDGAYKGGWWLHLPQKKITPYNVIKLLAEIPWPGLFFARKGLEDASLKLLKSKYSKHYYVRLYNKGEKNE